MNVRTTLWEGLTTRGDLLLYSTILLYILYTVFLCCLPLIVLLWQGGRSSSSSSMRRIVFAQTTEEKQTKNMRKITKTKRKNTKREKTQLFMWLFICIVRKIVIFRSLSFGSLVVVVDVVIVFSFRFAFFVFVFLFTSLFFLVSQNTPIRHGNKTSEKTNLQNEMKIIQKAIQSNSQKERKKNRHLSAVRRTFNCINQCVAIPCDKSQIKNWKKREKNGVDF